MKYFIGVDGGGTKTAFAVSTEDGKVQAATERTGCSYQDIGLDRAVELVNDGIRECLSFVGATLDDCAGCCLGMPCYGESRINDQALETALKAALSPAPVRITNDVEVGWAGSLECGEGIHVVAGTGSIAFGRGSDHKTARCGGWLHFFGDEGSAYWVGRAGMSLFTKEADGRVPRGALYETITLVMGLSSDFQFIDHVMRDWATSREKTAQFQLFVERAANMGDSAAADIYARAADELALMVKSLLTKLQLTQTPVKVSYSGGLFKAGELILQPFRAKVEALGCILVPPSKGAIEGALMLAIENFSGRTS